ncbi:PA14 domain-containing protein [Spirosoma knui]
MKRLIGVMFLVGCLLATPVTAQTGLKGEYFIGVNFARKVGSRIDRQLNFNWSEGSPARGIPHSYYSIRWTGKLLAPVTGVYRFYANVDDGIRLWIDNQLVIESWQLNDFQGYMGQIKLQAGRYYSFRVDYFNDMLGGELQLYWERPDAKPPVLDRYTKRPVGDIIPATYFYQKEPSVALATIPSKPAVPKPVAIAKVTPVRPLSKKPLVTRSTSVTTNSTVPPASISQTATNSALPIERGTTFSLPRVQFEQSSYVLLAESALDLDKLAAALTANPTWQLVIAGHTDAIGDARLNQALSENRAKVVAHYLIRKGIADSRITSVGYGGSRPIADNARETERAKNRRVEFTIR